MLKIKFSFQNGSALLSALFIMTLVAIAATAMSVRLQMDTFRTQYTLNSDKLYLASQAVTYWAMSELTQPKQKYLAGQDKGKILNFPNNLGEIYPNFQINGELYDLQSRFNLNNLLDKQYHMSFLALLNKLPIKLSQDQKKNLLTAIAHWINPPKLDKGQESWTNFYTKKKHLAGQQLLSHLSEFRLIQFVNAKIYLILSDFLSTLPEITPINVNTASPPVLATLGRGLKSKEVKELIELRGTKYGIKDMSKLSVLLEKFHIPRNQVTLQSQYFLSVAKVKSEHLSLTTYTLLKKNIDKQGKISIHILRETLNAYG